MENKDYGSNIKISMNAVISTAVAIVFMLIGIFAIDRFDVMGADNGAEYWIGKVLNAVATFVIMIAVGNLCEESRKKRDKNYIDRVKAIGQNYQLLMQNGESAQMEQFLHNINRANKYEAYIKSLRRKHSRCRNAEKKLKIEEKLLATPDEVWSDVKRVRYHQVTYNLLIAADYDVSENSSEFEMRTHKPLLALKKLCVKLIALMAFGWFAIDIGYSLLGFTKEMIVPLIVKIIMILLSAYSGVSFGYTVMDRQKSVLKNKLRIFSQFRTRIEDKSLTDDNRFAVEIEKDAFVEKLRSISSSI